MKYISYLFQSFFSFLFLLIRIFFGNRIHFQLVSFVSPLATLITKKGKIKVGRMSAIRSNTEVAANGGEILIGDRVFINKNCMIVAHERIVVGDGTTIGPNVCIYDHDHNFKKIGNENFISKSICIGKNVWIGAGAIILKGTSIGDNCVVGAGSVVKGSIEPNSLVYSSRQMNYQKY